MPVAGLDIDNMVMSTTYMVPGLTVYTVVWEIVTNETVIHASRAQHSTR
jgi:hypothetical protein